MLTIDQVTIFPRQYTSDKVIWHLLCECQCRQDAHAIIDAMAAQYPNTTFILTEFFEVILPHELYRVGPYTGANIYTDRNNFTDKDKKKGGD